MKLMIDVRYKTVLFRKFADAFLMMYQMATVRIFTNNGDFDTKKACKHPIVGVYRLPNECK